MLNSIPIRAIYWLGILFFPLLLNSQSVLKGKLTWNPKWGNKIYIQPLTDLEFDKKPTDSIQINRDGSFYYELTSAIKNNLLYRLLLPPKNGRNNSIIEGAAENTLFIYLPAKGVTQLFAHADSFYFSARIATDGINKKLFRYTAYKKPFRDLYEKLNKKITAFPDSAEKFKSEIYEEWLNQLEAYKANVKRTIIRSTETPVMLLGLYSYYMANFGRYDSSFFSQTISRIDDQQLQLVKRIKDDLKLVSNNRIGMVFPGLLLKDENRNNKTIRDFKATYYVVDFWASWCSPCRLSIRSHLPKLNNELKEKNILLLGISVDEEELLWTKALQTDKPTWPQLHDYKQTGSCHEYFQIFSYPTLLVLNENYEIIFETSSDFELESFIKKLNKK